MEKDIHERLDRARALATENVRRAASSLKQGAERVGESARSAGTGASRTIDGARVQAGKAVDQANRLVTEHPLAAAAAAAAAGALAAWLLPKTARHIRTIGKAAETGAKRPAAEAGELIEKIGETVARMAKATLDNARVMAADAARTVENEARAGLGAVRRAHLEERASKTADAAMEAASKLTETARKRAGRGK